MNNIAIFASGSGSNAENIIRYFYNHQIDSNFIVLTENPDAYVLERAKALKIKSFIFTLDELKNGNILFRLKNLKIDFIILAGFLKLIPSDIIKKFPNRIINIHPALLPKYGGKGMYGNRVHQAVIINGEKESGITIHYVNNNYDEGDIIFQARCTVQLNDTPETLAKRVHELEYRYYPEVVLKTLINKGANSSHR